MDDVQACNSQQGSLMTTRRFLPLFITQFLGAFNDNVLKNAIIILITYRVGQAASLSASQLISLAAGIFILPFFLFSATAGQLADKYEKAKLIGIIKFFEIMVMLLATFGFFYQSLSILLSALFLIGIQASFFGPLKYAILPEQIDNHQLVSANGLIEAGTFIGILLGSLTGGLLVLAPGGSYIISFIIVGIAITGFISSLYIPKSEVQTHQVTLSINGFAETLSLIRYTKKYPNLYITILGISWFWLLGSVFMSLFPIITKDLIGANETVSTLFIAIFSVGIALGSLLCNRVVQGKNQITYIPLGALGMTVFILDLYFALPSLSVPKDSLIGLGSFWGSLNNIHIAIDLLMVAVFGGLYTVPLYTLLQQKSESSHRARVIASNNIYNALFMVVGAIFTMLLLKLFQVNTLFLILGLSSAFVTVYICKLLPDHLIKALFIWILKAIYKVKVEGLENFENAGKRLVIVANHTSYLDGLLLASFLPEKLNYAVDSYTAEKWWVKLFLKMVNFFPLNPTNPMAIKSLIDFVKKDNKCVIFPEGRLTMTGALMKIYEGPGLIVDKADAQLLPICIQGAQFTPFSRLRGKVSIRFFSPITISIFPPQSLDIDPLIKGRERRQILSTKLYDLMTRTLFECSDYKRTLFDALIDAKETHGRAYSVIEDVERKPTNYQQLITRSFILGNLMATQTKAGESVGILLPNMISSVLTFFGLQAYCRIPAMLNFSSGIKNVLIACQTACIKTVYTSIKFVELAKLTEMVKALQEAGIVVIYLEDARDKVGLFKKLKGLIMAQFPRLSYFWINYSKSMANLRDPSAAAVILFTSGSEGTPKGVVLSHTNIQANRFQLSACIDFTSNDKIFNALPIFHSFGLTAGMLLPLLSGVHMFLYPSPLHYRIIPELSYDTNATILFGTNTFLSAYARCAHAYDFYSIRYVFAGAEKLQSDTHLSWLEKFGVRIFEGYGATETSPVLSMNTPMHSKTGTVGRFLPAIRYQLEPVPGLEEGGALKVSGPNIMKGYLLADNPGVLVPLADKWYSTGDIVSIDTMGYISIQGRVKRFAKISGEMVSLPMVESEIFRLWPEAQHAVISVPDEKKGEQIILITTQTEATRDKIIQHAKANQMADVAIPKKIVIIRSIPLLGTGKVDYTTLKENYLLSISESTAKSDSKSMELDTEVV